MDATKIIKTLSFALACCVAVVHAAESTDPADWAPIYVEGHTPDAILPNTFDATDYVQDGLVALYDGIENAGVGVRDGSAAIWKNLVAGGPDLTFEPVSEGGDVTKGWTDNAYSFDQSAYGKMTGIINLHNADDDAAGIAADRAKNFTIELAVDIPLNERGDEKWTFLAPPNHWSEGTIEQGLRTGESAADDDVYWEDTGMAPADRPDLVPVCPDWEGKYVTAWSTTGNRCLFEGAARTNAKGAYWNRINGVWTFAGRSDGTQCARGLYHAVRFYNRPLEDEELAWNRCVDDVRFRGLILFGVCGTNVQVRTSRRGVEATEKTGDYDVNGIYTFTAPTYSDGRAAYKSAGYRLEVLDPQTGETTVVYTNTTDSSFTYTNCKARACVRLTWLWTETGRLVSTPPRADDYVQDGLVAHYDAIDNQGVGELRQTGAGNGTWKNLVASGPDLTFEPAVEDGEITSAWTDNAYAFDTSSFAKATGVINLHNADDDAANIASDRAKNFTIELAVDIPLNERDDEKWTFLAPPNHWADGTIEQGLRTGESAADDAIYWEDTGMAPVDRPDLVPVCPDWEGKYVTALSTTGNRYLFEGAARTNAKGAYWNRINGVWTFAGRSDGSQSARGLYHAMRFYNRPLGDEELMWNRRIDEARFRGNAVTNVIVASTHEVAQGDVPNGVYTVHGSWEFTAPSERTVDGRRVKLSGYMVEELDATGAVLGRNIFNGTSYVYAEGESPATVRLTWRYGSPETIIFVR